MYYILQPLSNLFCKALQPKSAADLSRPCLPAGTGPLGLRFLLIVVKPAQCPMNFFTLEMNKSQDEA
jgi:hypothetical protein